MNRTRSACHSVITLLTQYIPIQLSLGPAAASDSAQQRLLVELVDVLILFCDLACKSHTEDIHFAMLNGALLIFKHFTALGLLELKSFLDRKLCSLPCTQGMRPTLLPLVNP